MISIFLLLLFLSNTNALRSNRKETCFYQQFQQVRDDVNLLMSGVGMRSIETRLQSPDVLYSLFLAANGDAWKNNIGWGLNPLICAWTGITCDDYGQVTEISLPANNLNGDISKVQLHRLKYLKKVDLSGNNLNGMIPDSIAKATTLKELVLKNNGLLGAIPDKLGNLTALEVLDLSHNMLSSGVDTLKGLTALTDLNLENNMITGELDFASSLTKLENFDVSDNLFFGGLPGDLDNNENLKRLDIKTNRLTGTFSSRIGNFGKLEYLDVRDSGLGGQVPEEIGQLRAVKYLDLSASFIGQLPDELGSLNNLKTLKIEAPVTGTIPTTLKKCRRLEEIELKTDITGPLPVQFSDLVDLRSIIINGGSTGALPSSWGDLSLLTHMDVKQNEIQGGIPVQWKSLKQLEYLDLSYNKIKDEITMMQNMTALETLYVNDNMFHGTIPNWIYADSSIRNLKLDGNLFECFIDDYCYNKAGQCDFDGNGTISCSRQHANNPNMFTVCEGGAMISGGQFVCTKPAIVHNNDHSKRGVPCPNDLRGQQEDLDEWCTELGLEGQPGFMYQGLRDCRAPRGQVVWCDDKDQWCDPLNQEGEWKKSSLSSHQGCAECYSEIRCGMQVKLKDTGSGSSLTGVVQVNRDGEWGTICGDFTEREALVACRSLGFEDLRLGEARVFRAPSMHEVTMSKILLKDIKCRGDEDNLASCEGVKGEWGDYGDSDQCSHERDLAVMCFKSSCQSAWNMDEDRDYHDLFESMPLCYWTDDKYSNMIWDEQTHAKIYVPHYKKTGVVIANDTDELIDPKRSSTQSYMQALVWTPGTRMSIYRDSANSYTQYAIDVLRIGLLTADAITEMEISWDGTAAEIPDVCYLLSSSDTHFLCMSSHTPLIVQFWETSYNSSKITFDHEIHLVQANGNAYSMATVVPSYGGTFAYDGAHFIFQLDGDHTSTYGKRIYYFDARRSSEKYGYYEGYYDMQTYSALTFSGVYYEWGACRYTFHSPKQFLGGKTHKFDDTSSWNTQCYTAPFMDYTCGNSICEPGETIESCPSDCTCGHATTEALQDPTESGTFYSYDICYQIPDASRANVIWDKYHDVLLTGRHTSTQICTWHGHQNFDCGWQSQTSLYYNRMVWSSATRILNWAHRPYNSYTGSHSSSGLRIGTIRGGAVVQYTYSRFDINAPGSCYQASAGPDQFLCLYGTGGEIYFFDTFVNDYTMKYNHQIKLRSYSSSSYSAAWGGTFIWDGNHILMALDGDNTNNVAYRMWDKIGNYLGQFNMRPGGKFQNMYFEWSQCRYAINKGNGIIWSNPTQLDAAKTMYRDNQNKNRASYSSLYDEVCYSKVYPPTL
jgi:Leucine-rich repeat (LRR) protein